MAKALAPETTPGRRGEVGHLADPHVVGAGGGAEHVDRRLAQRAGPLGARHHEGAGAVGDQAAVEEVQGAHLQRRGEDVVDGERVAVAGPRVERRPLPRAHGDLGQLLGRGAELVHVAGGRQRVGPHRRAQAVGHVPLDHRVGAGHGTAARAGAAGRGRCAASTRRR